MHSDSNELENKLICPVCKEKNDRYSIVCRKCKGYLQNRVPNLDLFHTAWKVIENPKSAYRLIVLSEHKNYVFLLYALFGIDVTFEILWYFRLGEIFSNILTLIFWSLFIGIFGGIILCSIVSLLHWIQTKLFAGLSSYRTSLGITGYSLIPLIISFMLNMPIKLLTFGMYYFTSNPNPMAIKPLSYIILSIIDLITLVWSFILFIYGTKIGNQISTIRSIIINAVMFILVYMGLVGGMHFFLLININ